MPLDSITLHHLRMPYVTPFQTSRWVETDREFIVVQLESQGLTAWGECTATQHCAYSYETTQTNWHLLEDFIIPAVFAADLKEPQGIHEIPAYRAAISHFTGHPMAKAGMEMALWDLFAQRKGISLHELLGGTRERVRVGVSVGIQPTTEALLETVNGYLSQGYARIKLKIKPGRDVGDVRAVRQVYPELLLQVDGNSVYRLEDTSHLKALDDFDLLLRSRSLAS